MFPYHQVPIGYCFIKLSIPSSVNIPWPGAGMGDADYLHAFHHIVMPIALEFGPDLIFSGYLLLQSELQLPLTARTSVSAGFDAAEGDELGECHVSPAGFAHMTHMLCSLSAGRVVVALEVCDLSRKFPVFHGTHCAQGWV
jgi:histone deacetylase 6